MTSLLPCFNSSKGELAFPWVILIGFISCCLLKAHTSYFGKKTILFQFQIKHCNWEDEKEKKIILNKIKTSLSKIVYL